MGLGIDLGRLATMVALVSCGASPESAKAAPSSVVATAAPSSPASAASVPLPPSSAGEPVAVASAAASAPTPDPYAQVEPLIPGTARPEPPPPPPPPKDPQQKACPTNLRRATDYSAASGAWARVQRGWSKTRLLQEIGGPASCDRSQWSYVAGPRSGPELTYRFTFQGDVVVGIGSSSVACRDF